MHVTEKGQVTIPIAIRRKYVIGPETEVEFVEDGGRMCGPGAEEEGALDADGRTPRGGGDGHD
ncbi:MAG: AbrB/MazE/SpoVT family DNA-binding domain-containing protein [Dehalococcoidia bacterium]|uniref:AbrB/MazE/SpoVT family DNA-binding domain-containing protein n=1 Tax=Candidatus Amarobacter glycogenicus TaxID=3140699 RepID=UPI003135FFC1|nr:AbrB/MazE/SpoVT family DNA-binding domain-containing protein [Dehalococcoidia bacterium]